MLVVWCVLLTITALAANYAYGLLLVCAGPPAAPQTRNERWFILFLGLQGAVALKVSDWCCNSWGHSLFAIVTLGMLGILLLQGAKRIGGEPAVNAIAIFGVVWWASAMLAISIQPSIASGRE
ncbi:MAG: hypothetical protein HY474_01970 [Candidatus Sungbacteria bacterium]|uniref:Uncharacterized protein n=1 Tax=Candidatus Sungiibacteriota bacterium TaxID=2750080 RepID=A0A932YWV8_9BACT|nr:hypothetical protein [Candidatus Sungbacteria bacterium]